MNDLLQNGGAETGRGSKTEELFSSSVARHNLSFVQRLLKRLLRPFSASLKGRRPALWRRYWGYPEPHGGRYEDYCENQKPVTLAKDILGRDGERYLFEQLVSNSDYQVLACNTENYYCEIDLVYLDKKSKEIVFVEVKTRRRDGIAFRPEYFSIDAKRRKKLALAGRTFRLDRGYLEYKERFDVAVVIMPNTGETTMRYHKAFFSYASAVSSYRGEDFGKTRSEKYLRDDVRERRHRDDAKPGE